MSKRNASIVSEILLLIVGGYYFCNALFVLEWHQDWYRGSAVFPAIVSGVLILATLFALYQDVFGVDRHSKKKIEIGDLKRLPVILCIMIAELIVWQVFHLFYVGMLAGTALMIYLLNVLQTDRRKRMLTAVGISAGFTLFIYVLFDLICEIAL